MNSDDAESFARQWIHDWNKLDVEAVLSHFADTARFTSPRAVATVGKATVERKDELRSYWRAALGRIQSLMFTLDHALWDPERRELCIVYVAAINGQSARTCEFMRFGPDALVIEGEAMHGASL
jgi:hypothetical protein